MRDSHTVDQNLRNGVTVLPAFDSRMYADTGKKNRSQYRKDAFKGPYVCGVPFRSNDSRNKVYHRQQYHVRYAQSPPVARNLQVQSLTLITLIIATNATLYPNILGRLKTKMEDVRGKLPGPAWTRMGSQNLHWRSMSSRRSSSTAMAAKICGRGGRSEKRSAFTRGGGSSRVIAGSITSRSCRG